MGNVEPVKITFAYTDAKGNKGKQEVFVQEGIKFNFGGNTYTVGNDGVRSGPNNDLIAEIEIERDKLDALMGISQMDNSDNLPNDSKAFVLSEKDIARSFEPSADDYNSLNYKVNQRLGLHESRTQHDKDYVNNETGELSVYLHQRKGWNDEAKVNTYESKGSVTVSSEKSREDADLDKRYAEEHWFRLKWMGITRQEYDKNHERDY